mgnify:FL=1
MRSDSENTFNVFNNPIDEIEEIINSYELDFLRNTLNELILSYKGLWNNYEVSFSWDQYNGILQVNNNLNILIPVKLIEKIRIMISMINEKIVLGYFGFSIKTKSIYFRHNISLRGMNNFSAEQVEDCIDRIICDCDKYFPAFQIFLHKKNNPEFAIKSALLETLGEA